MKELLEYWQEITETIRRHRLRTILTGLGIWWGVFMLVVFMGSGNGLKNGVMGMFGDQVVKSIYLWSQQTSLPYAGFQPGRYVPLTISDLNAVKSNFKDEINYVSARLYLSQETFTYENREGDFRVRGESPAIQYIEPIEVVSGRFLNEMDMEDKRKVIVIGKEVEDRLFSNDSALGKYLQIKNSQYQIIGVFESARGGGESKEEEETVLLPLTTAQQLNRYPNQISSIVAAIKPAFPTADMEEKISQLLKQRHQVAPDDPEGVGSFNLEAEFKKISNLFLGIEILIWVVGIGSLIAGIIGVGNIMIISVKERTKEIGLRKAIGATSNSIALGIVAETVLITLLSGYIGLVSSVLLLFGLQQAVAGSESPFFASPQIGIEVGLGAIFVLVFFSILVGLIPALSAARLNPVVALRDE